MHHKSEINFYTQKKMYLFTIRYIHLYYLVV